MIARISDSLTIIYSSPSNLTDVPAYLEWDGKNKYTLHLNNYTGPGLVFGQNGGADRSDVEVVINLTGTNTISSNNVGIDLWVSNNKPITFTGTGTLKINARIPMSNDVSKTFIYPSNDNKVDNTVEETVDEDLEEDTADTIYDIVDAVDVITNSPLYQFDCKVWDVDNANDAIAWLLFRNIDCIRNSKQQTAQTYLPHKELVGLHTDEQITLLKEGEDFATEGFDIYIFEQCIHIIFR